MFKTQKTAIDAIEVALHRGHGEVAQMILAAQPEALNEPGAKKRIRRAATYMEVPFYKTGLAPVHFAVTYRGNMKAMFDRKAENGKVGVIVSGRDCDCTSYHREYVMDVPASMVAFQREEDRHNDSLDGPESTYYVRPSEVDDGHNESRDLALEAFEDGHPHVVYA
jgi:hypothetical protein